MTTRQENQDKIQFLERRIEELTQELQETKELLKQQEKLAFLGEMAAMAFHDLKNKLNIIEINKDLGVEYCKQLEKSFRGFRIFMEEIFEDFFEDKEIITKIKKFFINIEKEVERITNLLDDVSTYLYNKDGEGEELQYQELNLIQTNLNELVSDCLDSACQSGELKKQNKGEDRIKLNLETDYDLSIDEYLLPVDALQRILINIIDNSYYAVYEKKKERGKDYIPTISIKTELIDEAIKIIIKDNGKGIPKDIGRKSTHPFFTTKPVGEGTGLGLYIVTKLVGKIQGKMRIKSEENEYTKVTLIIPIN